MDRLPNEILTKILGYLKTYDLIQFCRAFDQYSYLLEEKNITQIVNFSKRFEFSSFNLCSYIPNNFNCCHIKVLKINGFYWIKATRLRAMIRKLENLRELHAVDTKLGLNDGDILLYRKLNKLAVSVDPTSEHRKITRDGLKNLQLLFLKFAFKSRDRHLDFTFLLLFTNLEELWICDNVCVFGINYIIMVIKNRTENLKKIVIRTKYDLPLDTQIGFSEIFRCTNYNQYTYLLFEKIQAPVGKFRSIYEPRDELEKAWEVFSNEPNNLPCGPMETRLIHFKTDVKNIYFHDLNFCHSIVMCDIKYINAALQILSSKNCTKLKRLAFRTCLLLDNKPADVDEEAPLFKKQRIGLQMKCDDHAFQKIAKNLKNLTHLEITTCSRCINGSVLSSYFLISHFENLQKLSLVVSPLLDGSFLTQVIKTCQRLESLYLICLGQNETFIYNMCQALKGAEALRDFRLEHKELAISKILDTFNSIKSKKLLRIFLKCDGLRFYTEGVDIFTDFMDQNPQLVFFFIVINNNKKHNRDIQKILDRYKKGNQAKIFFVKKDATAFTGAFPIPAAHHDIIYNHTDVSVIDFDEF